MDDQKDAIKKFSLPMMVVGSAIAVFGLFGYTASEFGSGWRENDRIEMAVGVGLLILGFLCRKKER